MTGTKATATKKSRKSSSDGIKNIAAMAAIGVGIATIANMWKPNEDAIKVEIIVKDKNENGGD